MPVTSDRAFLVFHFGGKLAALPLEDVERLAPMAQVTQPPSLPAPLEGMLNLAGELIPVLRLDRLFRLPEKRPGMYSMLVILKADLPSTAARPIALLVDTVSEIVSVLSSEVLPSEDRHSFNGCIGASIRHKSRMIPLLSTARLLLNTEKESLAAFCSMESARLADWGQSIQ